MSSSKKIILGVLTAIPLLFIVLYFLFIFSFVFNVDDPGFNPESIVESYEIIVGFMVVFVLLSFGLLIYYLVDIIKYNKQFKPESNSKIIWLLVVLLAGILGMAVYYFVEILPRKEVEIAPAFPLDNEMME